VVRVVLVVLVLVLVLVLVVLFGHRSLPDGWWPARASSPTWAIVDAGGDDGFDDAKMRQSGGAGTRPRWPRPNP
jgi:hypothetical protein